MTHRALLHQALLFGVGACCMGWALASVPLILWDAAHGRAHAC